MILFRQLLRVSQFQPVPWPHTGIDPGWSTRAHGSNENTGARPLAARTGNGADNGCNDPEVVEGSGRAGAPIPNV